MAYFLCTETHYHSLYIVSDEFSTHPAEIVIRKDNDPTDVLVAPVDGFKSREEGRARRKGVSSPIFLAKS